MKTAPEWNKETFPPPDSWLLSLVTAAVVLAAGCGWWWFGLRDQGTLFAYCLHPLACVGHALTAAALIGLLLGAFRLGRLRSELSLFPTSSKDTMIDRAWQACLHLLPAPADQAAANGKQETDPLERLCDAWERQLTRRCWQFFGLAAVPFLLGMVLVFPVLSAQPPASRPGYAERMGPLAMGSLEAILLGVWAYWQAVGWDGFVRDLREKFRRQRHSTIMTLAEWENRLNKKEQDLNDRDRDTPRTPSQPLNEDHRLPILPETEPVGAVKSQTPQPIEWVERPE